MIPNTSRLHFGSPSASFYVQKQRIRSPDLTRTPSYEDSIRQTLSASDFNIIVSECANLLLFLHLHPIVRAPKNSNEYVRTETESHYRVFVQLLRRRLDYSARAIAWTHRPQKFIPVRLGVRDVGNKGNTNLPFVTQTRFYMTLLYFCRRFSN